MGPNGSGKSTMAYALAGYPDYEITSGEAWLDDQLITDMSVDERAKAGLFLAMQYPVEVAGVSVSNFLRTAKTAIDGKAPALRTWVKEMKTSMENLRMDPDFAERDVNVGFSGGEKKRLEILQMELLKPSFAVLDETDSGLDVDALRIVSEGVNRVHGETGCGVMLPTNSTRTATTSTWVSDTRVQGLHRRRARRDPIRFPDPESRRARRGTHCVPRCVGDLAKA